MEKFVCENCGNIFETDMKSKKEWQDRIYGPQWKWVAISPCCKVESSSYTPPKRKKDSIKLPPKQCNLKCCNCQLD